MNKKVNKPVVFHRKDPEDMELYEWLQRNLIKGEFTTETKAYWKKRYEESKKEGKKDD
jgi:hypothetical protein